MSRSRQILVCVTPQQSSRKLIERSRQLADWQNAELQIVTVLPKYQSLYPNVEILERLQESAIQADATMRILFHDNPVDAICRIVEDDSVATIVTGFPGKNSTDFVTRLHKAIPKTPVTMVTQDGTMYSAELISKESAAAHKQLVK